MISLRNVSAVFRFEARKVATPSKISWWLVLTLFPISLVGLLKWAEGKVGIPEPPQVEVIEVTIQDLSRGGLPVLEVDGAQLKGMRALQYVVALGKSQAKEQVGELLEGWLEPPGKKEEQSRNGRRRRGRRGRRREPPRPILLVQHPDSIAPDDRRIELGRTVLGDAFSRVEFYAASDPKPDVVLPSVGAIFWGSILFVLLPAVVSMLATFLWSSPAISNELERRSWAYVATRPHGPASVLVGNYAIGVVWGITAAMTALAVCLWIANVPDGFFFLFRPLAIVILLACPAYGAIYAFIGVLVPRRAMVISVVYTLVVEGVISLLPALGIPAIISRITVQYPLRSLMTRWTLLDKVPPEITPLSRFTTVGTSVLIDIASVVIVTLLFLALAVYTLRAQELTQADESNA